jgi:NADH-quinone oxidoreductase subunit K
MIPTEYFFYLAATLFSLGLLLVITRRNAVLALMGVEFMLNAANLNFVGFGRLHPERFEGELAALFVIVLAAAEAAVGLAIILNAYDRFRTVNLEEVSRLNG